MATLKRNTGTAPLLLTVRLLARFETLGAQANLLGVQKEPSLK